MKKVVIGTVGLLLFATAPMFVASAKESPTPQLKIEHGIPYVSGGFGVEERENLLKMTRGDNLGLSFALQNKQYLGGANVAIKDSKGRDVLTAISNGPLFFAKLPAGTYTVEATARGKTETQIAHVPASGQDRLYFTWKPVEQAKPQSVAHQ